MDGFRTDAHISGTGGNLPSELFTVHTSALQWPHYEVINVILMWVIS